ncbi:hypothetical protein [Tautonia plasticadhaerens]|uniref:MraY-like glycosyltransferase n=1 Tax=Tautonia plasticadhaerens TaxID=2527974 RepID=A0A518HA57_9BACT|nr:hypothetical protein [Tautonia plasticadhaerens]QDV37733.1 MraY-like glycosyltransferase [Tautonia plasticadhaerens]
MKRIPIALIGFPLPLLLGLLATPARSQEDAGQVARLERTVERLESQVDRLRSDVRELEDRPHGKTIIEKHQVGWTVLLLFAGFCALWAQDTGRNPWLWFILGLIFNAIAVVVLLWKNAQDRSGAAEKPYMPGEV